MKASKGQFDVEGKTPWPTPIGMGALADPEDFAAARKRELARKAEQDAFDRGELPQKKKDK
jgi:hypothetical protein